MHREPTTAAGYSPEATQTVHEACLYIATKLGDLHDDIVIVGGLVPSLIIPREGLPEGDQAHIGTQDVDLGLAIAILDRRRYRSLCERLRDAGFEPDTNDAGRITSQRWRFGPGPRPITVDFLIPARDENDRGGTLRNLDEGFAAIVTPGLELAFRDRRLVTLRGLTLRGERASRDIWVCEAGAFTVLKALAFDRRGENKDAYDLLYALQNYGRRIEDVYSRLCPLLRFPAAQEALRVLERDFTEIGAVGVSRMAEFLGLRDETVRADAAGAARALLTLCDHDQ